MASLATDTRPGSWRILFVAPDGARKTLRLGRTNRRSAESVLRHVEALLSAKLANQSPARETAAWLGGVGGALRDRLERLGLVEPGPDRAAPKLAPFVDGYIAERVDVKPCTRIVFDQARRRLLDFFGPDRRLPDVSTADADAYRAWLVGERKLAKNTVSKLIRYARHYFGVAVRRGIVARNPFAHLPATVGGNPASRHFVPADDVLRLIGTIPDPEWRLLLALARFQGLRIPSEALALRWGDVDFAERRLVIRASKTEHHEGGGIRVMPIFPETMPHLEAVFDAAPEGSEHVISRYRETTQNLRTQLLRYVARAGLTPWAKPWQNMRASRATELVTVFPSHVCSAWLGHTELIAERHYRMVRDEDFAKATAWTATPSAAQNPAQQQHAPERTGAHVSSGVDSQGVVVRRDATKGDSGQLYLMGGKGLEPLTFSV